MHLGQLGQMEQHCHAAIERAQGQQQHQFVLVELALALARAFVFLQLASPASQFIAHILEHECKRLGSIQLIGRRNILTVQHHTLLDPQQARYRNQQILAQIGQFMFKKNLHHMQQGAHLGSRPIRQQVGHRRRIGQRRKPAGGLGGLGFRRNQADIGLLQALPPQPQVNLHRLAAGQPGLIKATGGNGRIARPGHGGANLKQ